MLLPVQQLRQEVARRQAAVLRPQLAEEKALAVHQRQKRLRVARSVLAQRLAAGECEEQEEEQQQGHAAGGSAGLPQEAGGAAQEGCVGMGGAAGAAGAEEGSGGSDDGRVLAYSGSSRRGDMEGGFVRQPGSLTDGALGTMGKQRSAGVHDLGGASEQAGSCTDVGSGHGGDVSGARLARPAMDFGHRQQLHARQDGDGPIAKRPRRDCSEKLS